LDQTPGHNNMTLTDEHADQIAALLNERNQLTVKYTRKRVLEHAENYLCRFSEANEVVACVEAKRVQWYQTEVLHLTVAASQTRKGHAKALLCEAGRVARANGARLLQCTIREGNTESRTLFEGFGFSHISTFNNPSNGNNVAVFQKVLSSAR
jgi:ribosomal protein S18 acetylase RimI-like enzyme